MLGAIAGDIIGSVYEVLLRAKWTAEVTHDHPEGIKGARAAAAAIFLARTGSGKDEIRDYIERKFSYRLDKSIDEIRPGFTFQVSCQATIPPAITAFLESTDYEHAIRLAVSLGGDSDTIACIAGGIAQAYYGGIPAEIRETSLAQLDDRLRGSSKSSKSDSRDPRAKAGGMHAAPISQNFRKTRTRRLPRHITFMAEETVSRGF